MKLYEVAPLAGLTVPLFEPLKDKLSPLALKPVIDPLTVYVVSVHVTDTFVTFEPASVPELFSNAHV